MIDDLSQRCPPCAMPTDRPGSDNPRTRDHSRNGRPCPSPASTDHAAPQPVPPLPGATRPPMAGAGHLAGVRPGSRAAPPPTAHSGKSRALPRTRPPRPSAPRAGAQSLPCWYLWCRYDATMISVRHRLAGSVHLLELRQAQGAPCRAAPEPRSELSKEARSPTPARPNPDHPSTHGGRPPPDPTGAFRMGAAAPRCGTRASAVRPRLAPALRSQELHRREGSPRAWRPACGGAAGSGSTPPPAVAARERSMRDGKADHQGAQSTPRERATAAPAGWHQFSPGHRCRWLSRPTTVNAWGCRPGPRLDHYGAALRAGHHA